MKLQDRMIVQPNNGVTDAEIYRKLATQSTRALNEDQKVSLVFDDIEISLPEELLQVLASATSALSSGKNVAIEPEENLITTQQAAHILGVSRPTLIKMLDEGKIPYLQTSKHRRLYQHDVIAFREKQRRTSARALTALQQEDDPMNLSPAEIQQMRALVKEIRKGK